VITLIACFTIYPLCYGKEPTIKTSIYDFQAKAIDGSEIALSKYKGHVMLIVNTASACGFTPQYADLEKLFEKYSSRGLVILGFPCNQFGSQEPGKDREIATFCQKNYGVTFQMFDKVEVNGDKATPLYKYLKDCAPGILGSKSIKWNFTKFLVDKEGKVTQRYAPNISPKDLESDIEKLL
jgi:glutathione peroxidase